MVYEFCDQWTNEWNWIEILKEGVFKELIKLNKINNFLNFLCKKNSGRIWRKFELNDECLGEMEKRAIKEKVKLPENQ